MFFVALFPQFVPAGAAVLPCALLMAATIVALDLVWYSTLAFLVTRVKRAFVEGPWLGRVQRLTGAVLIGLGVKLAFERGAARACHRRRPRRARRSATAVQTGPRNSQIEEHEAELGEPAAAGPQRARLLRVAAHEHEPSEHRRGQARRGQRAQPLPPGARARRLRRLRGAGATSTPWRRAKRRSDGGDELRTEDDAEAQVERREAVRPVRLGPRARGRSR